MPVLGGDLGGWVLGHKTGGTTSYESCTLRAYCVWYLNNLGRAEPAGLGNNHLSPNVVEPLPQLRSLQLHLNSIFLFQTSTVVEAVTTAAAAATATTSRASAA